ncbi:MAG: DinB family protein [Chloroflexota bacterium]
MRTLQLMFQHNEWANRRVMDVVARFDPALLSAVAMGTSGSIDQTIKHLVGVEDIYLLTITGRDFSAFGSQEAYFGHDLDWFRARVEALGPAYSALLDAEDDRLLERPLVIPWINAPLTVREGLIQVLAHSAQHRAQILSTLGDRGHTVPATDYVVMRLESQATTEADQTAKA